MKLVDSAVGADRPAERERFAGRTECAHQRTRTHAHVRSKIHEETAPYCAHARDTETRNMNGRESGKGERRSHRTSRKEEERETRWRLLGSFWALGYVCVYVGALPLSPLLVGHLTQLCRGPRPSSGAAAPPHPSAIASARRRAGGGGTRTVCPTRRGEQESGEVSALGHPSRRQEGGQVSRAPSWRRAERRAQRGGEGGRGPAGTRGAKGRRSRSRRKSGARRGGGRETGRAVAMPASWRRKEKGVGGWRQPGTRAREQARTRGDVGRATGVPPQKWKRTTHAGAAFIHVVSSVVVHTSLSTRSHPTDEPGAQPVAGVARVEYGTAVPSLR